MLLFEWTDQFALGIQVIDEQHKKLVNLINELHEAMSKGQAKAALSKILHDLIEYTKYHFATEEKLMNEHRFPGYTAHKFEHVELTRQVVELQEEYKKGSVKVTFETSEFLRKWLMHHILEVDKQLADFLKSQGVK